MTVEPRWRSCVVAAPGPSLIPVRGFNTITVNDAWRMLPWADVLYAVDNRWWRTHKGCPEFQGEKWSTHTPGKDSPNNKEKMAADYGIKCTLGNRIEKGEGFSFDPTTLAYGDNSGFQAVNLALLFGCTTIVLIGFDMRAPGGKFHFFGDHPPGIGQSSSPPYHRWLEFFEGAVSSVPDDVRIINATPDSALRCFEMMDPTHALSLLDPASPRLGVAQTA